MISHSHASRAAPAAPAKALSTAAPGDHRIWLDALGYFLAYAPYSALTKAMSLGRIPGAARAVSGFELLPLSAMASLAGMFVFLTAMGWWKHAGHRTIFGVRVPVPGGGRSSPGSAPPRSSGSASGRSRSARGSSAG